MLISRRSLLAAPLAAAIKKNDIRRERFLSAPARDTAVVSYSVYTDLKGTSLLSVDTHLSRPARYDAVYFRYSSDNGRNWTEPKREVISGQGPNGYFRRVPGPSWADPRSGKLIEFWMDATFPAAESADLLRRWAIFLRVAGGEPRAVVHTGDRYGAAHPLPGVWAGRNCAMVGPPTSTPLSNDEGDILLPIEIVPAAPANPAARQVAVIRGRWVKDELEWQMGDAVSGDPARTTRGLSAPTIGALNGGAHMLVMSGSNEGQPDLPARRWISYSSDGGKAWTEPKDWTYHDGTPFYSTASASQLLKHSSGRLFWIGNIVPANARGGAPAYPLVLGEVDRNSGLLLRDHVRNVDTLGKDEDPGLSLACFFAREDRQTHEICVHVTRMFPHADKYEGDAWMIRIPV